MRAKDIRVPGGYSRRCVGRKLRPQRRIKSERIGMPRSGVYADRALQLRNGDAIEDDAAVAQRIPKGSGAGTIRRAEAADQLGRQTRLICEDGSNVPTSHDFIHDSALIGYRLTLAEWQVVGAIGVEGMSNVEECRAVAHAQVAHGEQPECTSPGVSRMNPQRMAPSVVHVELQAVPLSLTPVHLKCVIVAKARIR